MPIYCYSCQCGNKEEILQSIHSPTTFPCECGRDMQREIAPSSFVIKERVLVNVPAEYPNGGPQGNYM